MNPSEAIGAYAAEATKYNDRIDKAITGIGQDVTFLKNTILKIQNNPGPISTEDQGLLDAAQARTEQLASRLEAINELTPPEVPEVPVEPPTPPTAPFRTEPS